MNARPLERLQGRPAYAGGIAADAPFCQHYGGAGRGPLVSLGMVGDGGERREIVGGCDGGRRIALGAADRGSRAQVDGGRTMSATQSILTGAGFGAFVSMLASAFVTPPPIEVRSLTYDAGYIVQDRTVSTTGPWSAIWDAQILDVATGKPAPGCDGSGVWSYPPGDLVARVPLAEWVGSACTLGPGKYQPVATYRAGEFKTVARGAEFVIE
jgi:hypothetical protein